MRILGKKVTWATVDDIPRPVVAASVDGPVECVWSRHHRMAELLYVERGTVNFETEGEIWIVPPQCAMWTPAGKPYRMFGSGEANCNVLFIDRTVTIDGLPNRPCTISISPLLRELLFRVTHVSELYDPGGADGRLVAVLIDELVAAPVEEFRLPMPEDMRLKKLTEMIVNHPDDRATLQEWASRIAISERSLSRLLNKEVGMSFGQWRRQLHVIMALRRLATGKNVQVTAAELGYESASSFVTMFKKTLGKSPGHYRA